MKIYKSYRMYFCNEYTGQLNKFGGLPTHLPSTWPKDESGDELTFLCQLYCDGEKLVIENTLCIQIYQWVKNGEEGSDPIIVPVLVGARENLHGEGLKHTELQDGITPDSFLGMISDGDGHTPIKGSSPFNWGCGYNLVFYLNEAGNVAWDFY